MEAPKLVLIQANELETFPSGSYQYVLDALHTISGVMAFPLRLMPEMHGAWRKAASCLNNCL